MAKEKQHSKENPGVDWYFQKADQWQEEIALLRKILLSTGLEEELRWGVPCYQHEGANVALIHMFKEYCAVLFHKGVLLSDPQKLLVQQTENVQSARQMRFRGLEQVRENESQLKAYLREAIELEKAGAKVEFKPVSAYKMPLELKEKLEALPALQKAFDALTPGRQRGYLLYFSSAKQSKTREARVEKYMPQILQGKGLDD